MSTERVTSDARALIDLVRTRQLPFLAAAIAYYAFLSVVPLLIVGVTVATVVAGQALAAELLDAFETFLTPEAATLVEETLVDGSGRGSVTAFGLAVLLWSGLRVFRGLDLAFSRIYGDRGVKPLLEQFRDALLVLAGIGLAIAATVALGALLSLARIPLAGLGGSFGLLVVLSVVFLPMYYIFPAAEMSVRQALPGAVVAGLGWTVLGAGFGIYAANAGSLQLYGVLGGVLLLLIWFYFGGLILLFGAAFNVVLATSDGDRQLQQEGLRERIQRASMTDAADDRDDDDHARKRQDEQPTAPPDDGTGDGPGDDVGDSPTGRADPDVSARITQEDVDELRRELDEIERRLEDRTVHRDEIERDLKQYVRSRVRRGHATGWGPYLVLLYGTAMTLGAFVFLGGGWAILAMLVIWLSTLGLYALMIIVGITVKGAGVPFRLLDKLRSLR